jgi:hypothetical protein
MNSSLNSLTDVIEAYQRHLAGPLPLSFTPQLAEHLRATNKKPIYLVHGKPAAGKTTQSAKMAKVTGLEWISFESLLQPIVTDIQAAQTSGTIESEIRAQLILGQEITPQQLYRLLETKLKSSSVISKGAQRRVV